MLEEAGYEFEVEPAGIDEPEPSAEMSPWAYAAHLAWRKAAEVARRRSTGLILGADTICVVDGEILNKPIDRADAERMIRLQEGRNTYVISGICLYRVDRHEWVGAVEVSVVQFQPLSDQDRLAYLDSERWQGKSGGYGVQDERPVRHRRPRQLFQRGRAPARAARGVVADLSDVGFLKTIACLRKLYDGQKLDVHERDPGTSIRGNDRMAWQLIGYRHGSRPW